MPTKLDLNLSYENNIINQETILPHPIWLLQYIEQPAELCVEYVESNPLNIQYIYKQTLYLIELALSKNIKAAKYIKWEQLTDEDVEYLRLKYEIRGY